MIISSEQSLEGGEVNQLTQEWKASFPPQGLEQTLEHLGRDLQETSAPQSSNFWPIFRHSETGFPSQLLPQWIPTFAQRLF